MRLQLKQELNYEPVITQPCIELGKMNNRRSGSYKAPRMGNNLEYLRAAKPSKEWNEEELRDEKKNVRDVDKNQTTHKSWEGDWI